MTNKEGKCVNQSDQEKKQVISKYGNQNIIKIF